VEGGAISAKLISEPAGRDYFMKKHIGAPRYEEFKIQIGLSMDQAVYEWIGSFWKGDYQRKSGSIIACDHRLEVKSETEFLNALITEVTIPALDAASKDAAYLTVRFKPELTEYKKGSGRALRESSTKSQQKLWASSNFRLAIDGLDCKKVTAIDSFTVKQSAVTDVVGEERDHAIKPGKPEFPNLRITLAESHAQSWADWHKDFVIAGNSSESNEKNGSLTFLSANMATELGRINFFNLGIFRFTRDAAEAGSERVQSVTAELYCERMELDIKV
jgi:hypothetical protein